MEMMDRQRLVSLSRSKVIGEANYFPNSLIIPALLFILALTVNMKTYAQSLKRINYEGDNRCLRPTDHLLDDDGSVYLLGTLTVLTDQGGLPIEGELTLGSVITKLDSNSAIIWQRFYPIAFTEDNGDGNAFGLSPAIQMFFNNGALLVPYNIYLGYQTCNDTNQAAAASFKNGLLVVSKETGIELDNIELAKPYPCGRIVLHKSVLQSNQLTQLYFDPYEDRIIFEQRNSDFEQPIKKPLTITEIEATNTKWDFYDQVFITPVANHLEVRTGNWDFVNSYELPGASLMSGRIGHKMAFNQTFIAVQYSGKIGDRDTGILALFAKDGGLIKYRPTSRFADIAIDSQNKIYGLISPSPFALSSTSPATRIKTYSPRLEEVEQHTVEGAFLAANKISVDESYITVTGFEFNSSPLHTPKQADNIFLYRMKNSIQALTDAFCENIRILGNPIGSDLRLVTSEGDYSVYIHNMLGQKIAEYFSISPYFSEKVPFLSTGTYIIAVDGNNQRCNFKISKQ